MAESSAKRKERLSECGKWDAFVSRREELKKTMSSKDADAQATAEFANFGSTGGPNEQTTPASQNEFQPSPITAPTTAFQSAETTDEPAVLRWLYDALGRSDVTEAQAPSPGVWAHLQDMRNSPTSREYFRNNAWLKLLPNKSTMEVNTRKDDGRTLEILDRVEAMSTAAQSS